MAPWEESLHPTLVQLGDERSPALAGKAGHPLGEIVTRACALLLWEEGGGSEEMHNSTMALAAGGGQVPNHQRAPLASTHNEVHLDSGQNASCKQCVLGEQVTGVCQPHGIALCCNTGLCAPHPAGLRGARTGLSHGGTHTFAATRGGGGAGVCGSAQEAAQQRLSLLATPSDRGSDLCPVSLGAASRGCRQDALGIHWCQKRNEIIQSLG